MIQRIQSIFLLFSAICIGALYNFPFATSNIASGEILKDQIYDLLDSNFLLVFAGLSFVLSLATLFSFKHRALQIKLSIFAIITNLLLIVMVLFLFFQEFTKYASDAEINEGLGLYLSIGALILSILANRYIKKDEKIVKSMDRLR